MSTRNNRRRTLTGGLALTVAATLGVAVAVADPGASGAAAARSPLTVFGGYGYASAAYLGSLVRSGQTAVTQLCTRQAGLVHSNHTAALNIPGAGSVGAVETTLRTSRGSTWSASRSDTDTAATSLFGALSLTAIHTTSRVVRTATGFQHYTSTSIVGGQLAGHALPAKPTPDQTFSIPGIARVVLNHSIYTTRFGLHRAQVVGIHIVIPANNTLHLPAGSITIGHSSAALHPPVHANPVGYAFGTSLNAADVVGSGRTAAVYLPCGGTTGHRMTNRIARFHVPSALSIEAVYNTGYSSDNARSTVARMTSHIAGVNLFGGIIRAKAVNVAAQAVRDSSGHITRTATGSSVVALRINGTPRSGGVPVNTHFSIPGVGTLYGNRVVRTKYGLRVTGLQLVLSAARGGLKRGAVLIIGRASAGVAPN